MTAPPSKPLSSSPRPPSDAAQEIAQRRTASLIGFYQERNRMPSYSEMAGLFGVRSKNAVAKIVAKLEAQGLVYRDETGRCLLQRANYGIRRVGTVEAGFPSPAEEELGDCISLDEMLIQNRAASFLLTVTGDSMSEAGIMPGDLVVVDRGVSAKHGDIVIATVDGQWTMKYLHKKGGRIFLMAANPKYEPIHAKQEMTIHGVVRSCVRRYR